MFLTSYSIFVLTAIYYFITLFVKEWRYIQFSSVSKITKATLQCFFSILDISVLIDNNMVSQSNCFFYIHGIFFLLALQPSSGVVFYSPLSGFSLLACEVSWSHKGRATVIRTPLNEWSVRRRDLYLTTHNTQISKPWVGFEPTIAAGERP